MHNYRIGLRTALAGFVLGVMACSAASQEVSLPEKYKSSGALKVGLQNQFPPMNYVDPNTKEFVGFNIDLWKALEPKLGVKAEFVVDAFPSLFPALDTGRSDVMATGVFDSAERRQKYTFVDYLTSGPVFATSTARAETIKQLSDICGKSVGYRRAIASFGKVLEEFNRDECVAKGLPEVKIVSDEMAPQMGLSQNRFEVGLLALEGFLYLQDTQKDTLVQIGEPLRDWLFGIAFKKDDTELRDAVAAALAALIKDGTYGQMLAKYNLTPMAVSDVEIDKGTY